MLYKIQGKVISKIRGSLDIIPGGEGGPGPGPEPVVPIFEDDFEAGNMDKWDNVANVLLATWGSGGAPAYANGGVYGAKPNTNTARNWVNIAPLTEIWVDIDFYRPLTASGMNYWMPSDAANFRMGSVYSPVASGGIVTEFNGNYFSSTQIFTQATWAQQRTHYLMHDTAGVIQTWYDIGAGWVLDVDESGLDTLDVAHPTISRVYLGTNRTGQNPAYWDNFKIYDEDPFA